MSHAFSVNQNYYYYYCNHLTASFRTTWVNRHQKGKTSLDLNEATDNGVFGIQWHQLDHMQTICTLLQTDNYTNTPAFNFYRTDALPDSQPCQSTEDKSVT